MDAARTALDAAIERQKRLDTLIAEQQAKLDAINERRKARGSGRPPGGEAATYAAIERKIDRLQRGLLPDAPDAAAAAPAAAKAGNICVCSHQMVSAR